MSTDSATRVICPQCGGIVIRERCAGCGRAYFEPNVTWLPTDEDTNILFNSVVVALQNSFGHSDTVATELVRRYYANFTDVSYCRSIGIPVQNDDFFHHEGAGGMSLRIHYYLHLKRDPDPGKFIEWRAHARRET